MIFRSWDFGPKIGLIGLDGLAQVWTPLLPYIAKLQALHDTAKASLHDPVKVNAAKQRKLQITAWQYYALRCTTCIQP